MIESATYLVDGGHVRSGTASPAVPDQLLQTDDLGRCHPGPFCRHEGVPEYKKSRRQPRPRPQPQKLSAVHSAVPRCLRVALARTDFYGILAYAWVFRVVRFIRCILCPAPTHHTTNPFIAQH